MKPKKTNVKVLAASVILAFLSLGLSASASENPQLRSELEASYKKVRASLQKETPDDYVAAIDTRGKEGEYKNIKELWKDPQVKKALNDFAFPDLASTIFLQARQEGDTAGYYYRVNEPDGQNITVNLVRFKKVGDVWKPLPSSGSSTFPREADEGKNQQAIKQALAESSSLALVKK